MSLAFAGGTLHGTWLVNRDPHQRGRLARLRVASRRLRRDSLRVACQPESHAEECRRERRLVSLTFAGWKRLSHWLRQIKGLSAVPVEVAAAFTESFQSSTGPA